MSQARVSIASSSLDDAQPEPSTSRRGRWADISRVLMRMCQRKPIEWTIAADRRLHDARSVGATHSVGIASE